MAPVYFGFLHEMRGYTDRSGTLSREEAVSAQALDPKALSTFASPYVAIAGATWPKRLWTTDIAMCSIYLSPVLLPPGAGLALAAAAGRVSLVAGGLASPLPGRRAGRSLPLRGWLYDALPPMRYFRHAAMFRCYYLLTMVVLAMLAGRDLEDAAAGRASGLWKRLAIVCPGEGRRRPGDAARRSAAAAQYRPLGRGDHRAGRGPRAAALAGHGDLGDSRLAKCTRRRATIHYPCLWAVAGRALHRRRRAHR